MKLTAATLSTLALLSAAPASAVTLTVEELLGTYNGITSGNFASNQEVEGRLVVGGDLTGNTIQTGFVPLNPGPAQNVVVFGNTTIGKVSGRGEIVIGGNGNNTTLEESQGQLTAFIGGTHTGNASQVDVFKNQSGQAAFDAKFPAIDFGAIADYSAYLAKLAGSVWLTPDNNTKTLVSAPNAVAQPSDPTWGFEKVTVLSATLAQLSSGTLFVNGLDSDETIIVNVSGTSGTWNLNPGGDLKQFSRNILWNFYEADDITGISVNSAIFGSVLAPNAKMSGFSGSTEASVIAKTINLSNGELHYQPFRGDLPEWPAVNPPPPPPAPVPLPAGLPLLLAALGGLAMVRRIRA
jgi:choice-of-anchor A domain-containing protein